MKYHVTRQSLVVVNIFMNKYDSICYFSQKALLFIDLVKHCFTYKTTDYGGVQHHSLFTESSITGVFGTPLSSENYYTLSTPRGVNSTWHPDYVPLSSTKDPSAAPRVPGTSGTPPGSEASPDLIS